MVKETKFYDLLDASPASSENQLRKAYRKKALRLHPDKGGDPEAFKAVTHAYEVLSDPEKRALYDAAGEAGLGNNRKEGGNGMDASDLFSQMFGGGGFGGGFPRRQGSHKGKDLVHKITVSLADLYKGKISKLRLQKSVICKGCEGRGGKEGAVKTCTTCKGQGFKITTRQVGPMMQQVQQPCPDCDGTGENIDPEDRCKICNGKKVTPETKVLEVHIDKGMKSGDQIVFPGEANQTPGLDPGDVIIVLDQTPHESFQRRGNDLVMEQEIDLLTALGGGEFTVAHLDERALRVIIKSGEVVKHGNFKVLPGQGMPSLRHHELGDLYIKFHVVFPKFIPPEALPGLESALPARTAAKSAPKGVPVDEVELEEPVGGDAINQEEEDEGGEGQGVQCAQQ